MAGAVFSVFWRSWRRNFPNLCRSPSPPPPPFTTTTTTSSLPLLHTPFHHLLSTFPIPFFPVSLNHQITFSSSFSSSSFSSTNAETLVRHHILSVYLIPIFPVSFKQISSFSSSSSHHHHFPTANCDFIHSLDLLISFHLTPFFQTNLLFLLLLRLPLSPPPQSGLEKPRIKT